MSLFPIVTRCARFATVIVAALSLPAFAAPGDTTEPSPRDTGNQSAAAATKADAADRYCIKTKPTGTRVERKTCKTKAGWAREGVDIEQQQIVK